ncbi:MAG TPA: RsmG family class I SAM-dependent methyltransferase [Gemmataceae bacterium]|nr:RsmG family class I SAM-dependent methyltransferase [Gemmataceae bacterium]
MPRTEAAELRAFSVEWGVPLDDVQGERLVEYAELLIHWNRRINLTGARATAAVVSEHYPDAFALASRLAAPARLVDVGSGGGLPVLPLALLRPELNVLLCEPIAKKAAFLRTAIRDLGLSDRVSLKVGRGEDLPTGGFEVAVSRATLEPQAWLALGRRLVHPGGRVLILTVPGSPLAPAGATRLYAGGRRLLIDVPVGSRG